MESTMAETDWDFGPPQKPSWICQDCGFNDKTKPLPKNRAKYYASGAAPSTCRRCKSKSSMPHAF